MNRSRITKAFLFGIYRAISSVDMFFTPQISYEDCTIYSIRSLELSRTYECYHVVGPDVDFVFKKADQYELQIYYNLNRPEIRPRLSVPILYEYVELRNKDTGKQLLYIAIEFIQVNKIMTDGNCRGQVDGILMYEDGKSSDAWKSAGEELARIHSSFWNVDPLPCEFTTEIEYTKVLQHIQNSPKIASNIRLKTAVSVLKQRLSSMPICLVHFDLFPINVLIKERNMVVNGNHQIKPRAYFVDWATARPAPYVLDLARLISHCHRIMEQNKGKLMYSPKFCEDEFEEICINAYYDRIRNTLNKSKADFITDLICGKFFEIARMFIQMPTPVPMDSYDRYYTDTLLDLANILITMS